MRFLSLFSGIEAASVAWLPLGWECVAVAEIEPFPCAALAHHYPNTPNLGDVTKITREQIEALGHIDIVVGGFPCQDVSVAGKRKGFHNVDGTTTRSGLFFTAMRIAEWSKCRYLLVENVPGLFSSHGGEDFNSVVREMVGCEFSPPKGKWQNTGCALGPRGILEWCVLDAQWFGVPQRRKRVFALRDSGNWFSRPPVLFDSKSLCGHPAPSRKTGEGFAADVAPSLTSSGRGVERTGESRGQDPVIAQPFDVANCLTRRMHKGINSTVDGGQTPIVTHSLRAEHDASEDGTGRGTPLVPVAIPLDMRNASQDPEKKDEMNRQGCGVGSEGDPAPTVSCAHVNAVAFSETGPGSISEGIGTIRAEGENRPSRPTHTILTAAFSGGNSNESRGIGYTEEGTPPLRAGASGTNQVPTMCRGMSVRRLTPKECARLQGFPDDYLDITYRGKPAADGPKYKALGNSMAVPCMRWIGRRIQMVEDLTERAT